MCIKRSVINVHNSFEDEKYRVKFSVPVQRGPEDRPVYCTMDTESISRGQSGRAFTFFKYKLFAKAD